MKLTKDMLDKKVKEFEIGVGHNLTYREWFKRWEEELSIENENLDDMTEEELDNYDSWICEIIDK